LEHRRKFHGVSFPMFREELFLPVMWGVGRTEQEAPRN
jgi:hypothetical protein